MCLPASQEPQIPKPGTAAKDCRQNVSRLDPRNHLAFYLATVTRERERKKLPAKSNSTSNPSITDGDISTDDEEMWIESLQLFERDKIILTTPRQWLNSSIIDTAQQTLATQFKSTFGFQSVGCGLAMTFAVEQRPYVQVLHDSTQKHWLTISNIGAEDPASVLFYDSLFHQCDVQQQVAAIYRTKSSQINAHFVDVQRQSGGSD